MINTSVSRLDIETMVSVPRGSVPIGNSEFMMCIGETAEGYSIHKYHHRFYFPYTGEFTMDPCSVFRNQVVIAKAQKLKPFVVKDRRTETSHKSLEDYISA